MINGWVIIAFAFIYVGGLFCIAYWGDKRGRKTTEQTARPTLYALTLAVYCTSWTFFGSVGFAASTGFDFIAVYMGPILAFTFARQLLRRIIRLCKIQNITSIADFISARYGKSTIVAAVVTIIAVFGTLPYIALQLKAISQSTATLLGQMPNEANSLIGIPIVNTEFLISLIVAAFAIFFGTRHSDATEHQPGLMLAVAVESIVKVLAFLAVGGFIVFSLFGGFGPLIDEAAKRPDIMELFNGGLHGGSLFTVTFLSFVCVFLLPRQFHVAFVESASEEEVKRASWLFPLYLIAINIFVVPVAIAGLLTFPANGVARDMYLLALPLNAGNHLFTLIAFAGGLSAATAMVVVETIALSIMVCNDLVMPLFLRGRKKGVDRPDMRRFILNIRRFVILALVLLAYSIYETLGHVPLASIGLLSFAAIAQFAPAFFGGLYWRRATARGAIAGIVAGFAVWLYTLLLPNMLGPFFMENGLFDMALLRPRMLFYLNLDPLAHGVIWSLFFNVVTFVTVSLLREPKPIERLQANIFIEEPPPRYAPPQYRSWRASVTMQDLVETVSRYLGADRTRRSFADYAASRGILLDSPIEADLHAVRFTENLLASAIGAASSRLVMSLAIRPRNVGVNSALKLLDDASEAIQYNRDLLQTALDHVRHGLAVFDKEMRLICWNRQFREILGLPPPIGRFGIALDQIVRHMAQTVCNSPVAIENFVTDRLTKYVVTMSTFQERLSDGRVIEVRTDAMPRSGIVVTYMDITERVNAEEALAKAKDNLELSVEERTAQLTALNRELEIAKAKADEANIGKTRFLAAASHDILQPLNAARLYAASLRERSASAPQEYGRLAGNIDASLDAVEEILNALLDISRLDTGAMKPDFSIFAVNDLFEQLLVDFEPIAKARGLDFRIIPSTAYIKSDRRLMRRVLQNLVSNALKYTEKGGVVLGCRKRGRTLVIAVHDTGPGIPEHQKDLIFKEFQRLDQKGTAMPGLGLGLSIVERMCRVLDHPLELKSKLGRGSVFSVAAPLARWSRAERQRLPITRSSAYGDLRGCVVLCIENDRAILDGMHTLLVGWQCIVMTAQDSADAIAQINGAKTIPDIVISDYHLEQEFGTEAVRTLISFCKMNLPAIIITADRSPAVREKIASEGFGLLHKPVKPAALRALVAQKILRRQAAE